MKKGSKSVTGVLGLHFDGYGFVVPEAKGVPDVFIPAHAIGDALHRDVVEVGLQRGREGKIEGRIIRIIERGMKQLVGRYELCGKSGVVITEDLRVRRQVIVPPKQSGGARHNEMVIVGIIDYPLGRRPIVGKVLKRLGHRGSDKTEITILIARHNLPGAFSEEVVAEAKQAADGFSVKADGERRNLTRLPFITIDGEDAKDFDDAVYASRLNRDSIRLLVSIADVSHFVKVGSKLDREAALRGTSVYFPGFCIPMLPEDLSNNICSLIPGEERYCFTAELVIDSEGRINKQRFFRSLIKSHYRMTYTEANELLQAPNSGHQSLDADILGSLRALNDAAGFFRKQRRARGSIDFDLPEPAVVLDMTGKPENIVKAERNIAHMLIEDLMIAANEAVALFLTRKGYPCIYRVHDRPNPEKLIELKVLLKYLGHKVSIDRDPHPGQLAEVVSCVEGRPEERLINMLLLRSMAQAVYSIQNIGHYGLASKCYCHFTSPIRRYPDLVVHRLLDRVCSGSYIRQAQDGKLGLGQRDLARVAEHSSKAERRAMEAERETQDLYSAIFMRDKIGEVYDGLVSHTAKKGIFVELIDYFVEGIISPEDLTGDRFHFEPKKYAYLGRKTGRSIHIGDRIRVVVKDVSIEERRIFFTVSE